MAEVFSDDLNLKIGDLLLNPLYHATRKTRARLFMLMHACARASSKLRASLTSATIVASDLFSNPLSFISKVARPSGRAASAGGHHGGPRRATRRSQIRGQCAQLMEARQQQQQQQQQQRARASDGEPRSGTLGPRIGFSQASRAGARQGKRDKYS
jgi:hypothetical protein